MMTPRQAGEVFGRTDQTILNWVKDGRLRGDRKPNGRWWIDPDSVEKVLKERGRSALVSPTVSDLAARVAALAREVSELRASLGTSPQLVHTVRQERDRYRSEAAAVRDAALLVNSAARDTGRGVQALLTVLERQADALAQLLAPGHPPDLMP